ncbi:MAG: fluoride efflux transporter CrcB [Gemmatimonadota bacterium]
MTLVAIAVGGALGAVSRYLAGGWVQGIAGGDFPWGTWTVNLVGSLALGFMMIWLHHTLASTELRHFVVMGFLGSFTTFSTFSLETVEMLQEGLWLRAGLYSLGSVALGLLAVVAGAAAATSIFRPSA